MDEAAAAGASPADGQADLSGLNNDLASIDKTFDPQIQKERESAEHYEGESVRYSEIEADQTAKMAELEPQQQQEIDNWLKQTPTRAATYSTVMHQAPMLALLTAIGGKVTKLSGMNMLAATNGIVQGLNTASDKLYEDSYNAWMQEYQKLKEHQTTLMHQHQLMLEAYRGRADAYQKAADAARRMTGDLLTDKQNAVNQRIHAFTAQSQALDRLARQRAALEANHERVRRNIAQEAHWKAMEHNAQAKGDPRLLQQLKAEHQEWTNAKALADEAMKRRGQINGRLDLTPEVKEQMLAAADRDIANAEISMQKSIDRSQALAASMPEAPAAAAQPPPSTANPSGAAQTPPAPAQSAPAPGAPPPAAAGPAAGAGEVSPGKRKALEQHKGTPVKFGDGTTWIMDNNGQISRVQ